MNLSRFSPFTLRHETSRLARIVLDSVTKTEEYLNRLFATAKDLNDRVSNLEGWKSTVIEEISGIDRNLGTHRHTSDRDTVFSFEEGWDNEDDDEFEMECVNGPDYLSQVIMSGTPEVAIIRGNSMEIIPTPEWAQGAYISITGDPVKCTDPTGNCPDYTREADAVDGTLADAIIKVTNIIEKEDLEAERTLAEFFRTESV